MFFLTGLLGMMALGSVAILGTTVAEDDMDEPGEDGVGQSGSDYFDDAEADPSGDTSLFARLGLTDDTDDSPDETVTPEPSLDDETALQAPEDGPVYAPEPGLTEVGGPDDDTLDGTEATDFLGGGDGDDVVSGAGGSDELTGGAGLDTLDGGDGDDTLHGESGNDSLRGAGGADTLYGYDGDDVLDGGEGRDSLEGGLGNDFASGGGEADALHGREGADTLIGGHGADTLFGGWDNDLLIGVERDDDGVDRDVADYLNGGDGDDMIVAGNGDVVGGGNGSDTLVLGDWITDQSAELWDFDAAEDQIVIVFDDSDTEADPDLTIRVSEADPALSEIVVDGQVLGTVATAHAPSPDMIVLVGESVAGSLQMGTF